MNNTTNIFWFRRDLRLDDNAGLFHALQNSDNVLPIFIFDSEIVDILNDREDKRINFIYQTIQNLKENLVKLGSNLEVYYGKPINIFKEITELYTIEKVFTNHDYEPYGLERDNAIHAFLSTKNIEFLTFKDQVIFEKQEILTDSKKPYTIYSPYARKWRSQLNDDCLKPYRTEEYFSHFLKNEKIINTNLITLEAMNFKSVKVDFPKPDIVINIIEKYAENRNFPAIKGTTYLGIHLRFGTISIRKLTKIAQKHNESFLNELTWRDFYMMILANFPHAAKGAFKANYDKIEWRNNKEEFEKWCNGKTGYPIVDAGMRELNATGYMHNRVRMITASFLTKHLLIDWRWGEAYFAEKLLDFDMAANNGGWQWASGSGCDAAPYFRIFNPTTQTEKFDKQLIYIKKWIPELNSFEYPKPIVEHTFARNRCLETYKKYLV
ncbi:MAG: deoxyribodipyrimidine photo-lyase [Cytophagia bacterium]|nr:MAG: deoxyribodipyrimidine photo-lyase [Cytophagia bacterium]TAG43507.1 MAG: deoxyribodipyrimidine photo-lyase [Cytophagia bacterium]